MRFVRVLQSISRILLNCLVGVAALGALLSLCSFFSRHHLYFDLISHFRVQYIVLLLPVFLIAAWARKTASVLIISFALAVHGYAVAMSLLPVSTQHTAEYAELSVLNSNLLFANTNYQAQLDIIKEKDPDLIAFQEYTHRWHRFMWEKLSEYQHRITEPAARSFGIAIYSKHPITEGAVEHFTPGFFPAINVDIQIQEFSLRVIAVHPPPPSRESLYLSRNHYMERIALESRAQDGALLVTGDFNATPWTSHFTDMLKVGGLRNTRAGHGLHPTWPTPIFALRIPIDHILVNEKIGVDHFEAIHLEGSDHRNVLSRLRVY